MHASWRTEGLREGRSGRASEGGGGGEGSLGAYSRVGYTELQGSSRHTRRIIVARPRAPPLNKNREHLAPGAWWATRALAGLAVV